MKTLSTCRSHQDRLNIIKQLPSQALNQRSSSILVNEDEDVRTLTWLGLTERQAKVYLALLHIGVSKAEAISKASSVHRQEIYRVVARLQEMGLVETEVTSPNMFIAVPVKPALEIMVNQKTKELNEVRNRTRNLIERFNRTDLQASSVNKPYFIIASGSNCLRKLQNELECSRKSIKIVTNSKRFCQDFSIHEDLLKNALTNKIQLRVITESPKNEIFPKWVIQTLVKESFNFELKIIPPGNLSTSIALYDNAKICVCIDVMSDLSGGSQLWSNSDSLIALGREYFECMWLRSETYSEMK